jgi:hypothetical protein
MLLWAPPLARGNIDPASDVLLLQNLFLPYQPKVCSELADPLRDMLGKTSKDGFPLKVAVISSRADLGGAPQYLGRPQPYAKFLGGELGVFGPDVGRDLAANLTLLTVMKEGFGYYRSGSAPNVATEARRLPKPGSSDPSALVRATLNAVPKVARAAGHPVAVPDIPSGCSTGGGTSPLVFVVPVALLILVAGTLAIRNQLRPEEEDELGHDEEDEA